MSAQLIYKPQFMYIFEFENLVGTVIDQISKNTQSKAVTDPETKS